jgi:hypothetical protein
MQLCINEFYVFLSELQTATYNVSARSLRYILETALDACDFQSDVNRPNLSRYMNALENGIFERYLMHNNAWTSFIERYRIY